MLAQTAERAKFDFFFLAEGLRLREHRGRIHDLDVVGRPDTFTVLAALAAVTDRIGLSGTINSTFNEPYEVARQFASLDHLSGGRAAWNVVTSWDAFTGENFRRGGFLAREDRYDRAREFLQTARELWDSWDDGAVVADPDAGHVPHRPGPGAFAHHGVHFDIEGVFGVPRSPQGQPVIFQAGDSDTGREFAAADAGLHLLPSRDHRGRPALLPGREGAPGPLRPVARRAQDPAGGHLRPRRQRGGRHRAGRGHPQPAGERGRRPSCSWSRSGTATSPGYDPDGPCRTSDPDLVGADRGRRAGPMCVPTGCRPPGSGGPWPRRRGCRSAS